MRMNTDCGGNKIMLLCQGNRFPAIITIGAHGYNVFNPCVASAFNNFRAVLVKLRQGKMSVRVNEHTVYPAVTLI